MYKNILKYNRINIIILSLIPFGCILFIFQIYNYEKNTYLFDSINTCHDSLSCNTKNNAHKNKYAFVSVIHNIEYLDAALVLGYTIKKYHKKYNMYLMHYKELELPLDSKCKLERIGWELYPVNIIETPSKNIKKQFQKNFIKLHLWNMTLFESIIYLDADTIIFDKIDEIFKIVDKRTYNDNLGFEFAATPDNYGLPNEDFNAGVFVLRPNIGVYNEMLRVYKKINSYNIEWAEQSFLNEFFRFRYIRLPEKYNFNVEFWNRKPNLWKQFLPDMKIIHYTTVKPFLKEHFLERITFRRYKYKYVLNPWYEIYNEMKYYSTCKNELNNSSNI